MRSYRPHCVLLKDSVATCRIGAAEPAAACCRHIPHQSQFLGGNTFAGMLGNLLSSTCFIFINRFCQVFHTRPKSLFILLVGISVNECATYLWCYLAERFCHEILQIKCAGDSCVMHNPYAWPISWSSSRFRNIKRQLLLPLLPVWGSDSGCL